jgi:hypothetical protein
LRVSVADSRAASSDLFIQFAKDFPEVQVEISMTSRHVDLVNEGIDVALRYGAINDSSLVVRVHYKWVMDSQDELARPHSNTQPDDISSDPGLRTLASWVAVGGTALLASYFFLFLAYQLIWGPPAPGSWLAILLNEHYAAMAGTPLAAVTAFCIVSILKVTNGPIEFEGFGFKFRGASGPIILWLLCFGAIACAFYFLWSGRPDPVVQ